MSTHYNKRPLEDEDSSNDKSRKKSKCVRSDIIVPDKYEKLIFRVGDAEIHFNAPVDTETISRLKKLISVIISNNKDKLVKFNGNGKVPDEYEKESNFIITYIVNSPGGSVHDVLDFVDYINVLRSKFANIKFTSIITGMVASAGTIMCIIADKKLMTRFAFAMIHELSAGLTRTNYTRILTHSEFIQNIHRALVTIYQEYRGISMDNADEIKKLEELLIRETWMTAEQYKNHGFIDNIIANKK